MKLTRNLTKSLYLFLFILITGCTQTVNFVDIGQTIKHQIQGSHLIMTREYVEGEKTFRQAVKENPDNAEAQFYLGRFLLAREKNKEALNYLQKAVALKPNDVEYTFWLGVAYGENGMSKKERQTYKQALKLDKDHLQTLIYLGHTQLKNKEYKPALKTYTKVLELWPESPSALYNRALIMKLLGRTPEEQRAWHEYLTLYPAGNLARRATNHLNSLSDFSYRNNTLGSRTITLKKIAFKPFTAELDSDAYPSLKLVGAVATNMDKGVLQVLVYQKNNKELAKQKAIQIKKYLLDTFPDLNKRIGISWFADPEKFSVGGKSIVADESVRFFLSNLKK